MRLTAEVNVGRYGDEEGVQRKVGVSQRVKL